MTPQQPRARDIPVATVSRLPDYLRALATFAARGTSSLSSDMLAAAAGVRPTQLRKDLSHLGSHGVRGVGYDVARLTFEIGEVLGLARRYPVVIVGMGNLGRALAAYSGFSGEGFSVAGLVDRDPALVGESVGGVVVSGMPDLPALVRGLHGVVGVVATPPASAQEAVDALVSAGVDAILNFAPGALTVPDGVVLRRVDLATELRVLTYLREHRVDGVEVAG
ncbi:MAG: redox-sensing transcriptional repressor Rex [Dermatophilaceae bacterium]